MTKTGSIRLALCLAAAAAATAGAGQVTNTPSHGRAKAINQNCAIRSGCFADDPSGFPVTITEPGAYQLNSNLDVRGEINSENVTAIEILSAGVTLDLNGFQVLGPVNCTGTPVTSCSPTGGIGDGIHVSGAGTGVKIFNGTVRGAGRNGIRCAGDCWIDSVAVLENAVTGIDADSSGRLSRVARSQAIRNGGVGITVKGLVKDSLARGNFVGLRLNGKAGMVVDCVASSNTHGIAALSGTVRGSTVFDNTDQGLFCLSCLAESNNIFDNGTGIQFSDLNGSPVFGGNRLDGNTTTIGSDGEVEIATNICDGSPAC